MSLRTSTRTHRRIIFIAGTATTAAILLAGAATAWSERSCAARAELTRQRLVALEALPPPLLLPKGVELPVASFGQPVAGLGMVLTLHVDGLATLDGRPVGLTAAESAAELRGRLARDVATWKLIHADEPPPRSLYILLAPAAPLAHFAPLLEDLATYRDLRLLVTTGMPAPLAVPPPSWLRAVLDEAERRPEDRATLLAEAARRAAGLCAPLIRDITGTSATEPSWRSTLLRERIPADLCECRCGRLVSPDALDAVLAAILQYAGPEQRLVPLPLTRDPAAPRLSVRRAGTVAALLAALGARPAAERARPFRLALE
jgi:hypothetical protein